MGYTARTSTSLKSHTSFELLHFAALMLNKARPLPPERLLAAASALDAERKL
jgi:hypothetical protein